jgi:hypothetical protein
LDDAYRKAVYTFILKWKIFSIISNFVYRRVFGWNLDFRLFVPYIF